ncbi:MAG TPA: aminotransferase, partial [Verrucomicrobiales bacterium]|nr:aminotransferase [Verrucomicrobiales bacterium]
MAHVKLHIPGPVEVSQKSCAAMSAPMIGHRSQGFKDLYAKIQPQLQQVFHTKQLVYLSTSSAWGVMEGALRNLVAKKVLCCMNGAFSDKWLDVAQRCGKQAEGLQVEWGQPIRPEQIDAKLATGQFDALTLIHNETSTGTMSPLTEIAQLKAKYPDVMFIVDSVSSCSAVKIEFDALGIDVLLTGSQKAFALPPGLAMFAVSPAALAKAARQADRGYYFDFVEFQKNAEQHMTPSTPCISLIYGLASQLDNFLAEGLENRYARHA